MRYYYYEQIKNGEHKVVKSRDRKLMEFLCRADRPTTYRKVDSSQMSRKQRMEAEEIVLTYFHHFILTEHGDRKSSTVLETSNYEEVLSRIEYERARNPRFEHSVSEKLYVEVEPYTFAQFNLKVA